MFDQINTIASKYRDANTAISHIELLLCAPGYYWKVTNGGLCSNCPVGCDSCENDDACSKCLDKYYLY